MLTEVQFQFWWLNDSWHRSPFRTFPSLSLLAFSRRRYRILIWIYACPPLHPSISVKIWKVWRIWRIWKPTFSPGLCYIISQLVGYLDYFAYAKYCAFFQRQVKWMGMNTSIQRVAAFATFPFWAPPPLPGNNFIPFLAAYIRIAIRVRPTTSNIPITTLWCRHCPSQNGRCTRSGGIQIGRVHVWCTNKYLILREIS